MVFCGDPVEPDCGGGESAAVVTQDDSIVKTGGDCGCLAGQLAHAGAVGCAGGGVGGGLDEQAAFGRQPGIGATQPGAGGGGERDGGGLGVPACLAGQDGQVPGCFGAEERVAAAGSDGLGAVGCHPAELLVI